MKNAISAATETSGLAANHLLDSASNWYRLATFAFLTCMVLAVVFFGISIVCRIKAKQSAQLPVTE